MSDPIEWDFGVPPSQVDIDQIHAECLGLDVFSRASYILTLETKAPTTFLHYRDKYLGGVKGWGR